jgi:acetate kinase
LKCQIIEVDGAAASGSEDHKLARALVDRIGENASCTFQVLGAKPVHESARVANHEQGVKWLMRRFETQEGLTRFDGVGHRVVHGGDRFTAPALITEEVVAVLDELTSLAPLHNPPSLSGIRAARSVLGNNLPMVAVFDTSFHQTLPAQASTYAIPYDLGKRHKIRRYGFHGLAHHYAALRYGEITQTPLEKVKIVTLHLGNGCSASAIQAGKSVDTSMGFTPLEGLVMGTRSGDLDPAVVAYLATHAGAEVTEVENWLNKRSGLLGLSGLSNDMRKLVADYGVNPRAKLAVDVFCYRARKYLGAYLAVLGGADAVIFSGGIGENSPVVREKICNGMEWCGVQLDRDKNGSLIGCEGRISPDTARVHIYVIPSDEEALIARETANLVQQKSPTSY